MDAEATLVLWSRPFMQTLVVTSHESSKSILALIGQAVSEKMFENNGHGHAYRGRVVTNVVSTCDPTPLLYYHAIKYY